MSDVAPAHETSHALLVQQFGLPVFRADVTVSTWGRLTIHDSRIQASRRCQVEESQAPSNRAVAGAVPDA